MDPESLDLVSAGISAAGQFAQGIGGYFAGQRQEQAYKMAASQTLQEAGVQGDEALLSGDRTAAHAAVQGAANGGGLTGSTLGVINDLSNQAMFNARAALYRGQTQASSLGYQGRVASANGVDQLIAGTVGSGSTLLGGWAKGAIQTQTLAAMKGGGNYYGYGGGGDGSYGYGDGG